MQSKSVINQPQLRENNFDVAAVGTVRQASFDFFVATLIIQNPSGMWLYIPAARQYVPPQSLGAVVNLTPPTRTIVIQYVNAPTGGIPSAASGGPITVDATDAYINPYQGLDYGLDQNINTLNTSIQTLTSSINALKNGWGTGTTLISNMTSCTADSTTRDLIVADPTKNNILMALTATWGIASVATVPRGYMRLSITNQGGNSFFVVMLSPEQPTAPLVLPPSGIASGVNQSIRMTVTPFNDTSTGFVNLSYSYYQQ